MRRGLVANFAVFLIVSYFTVSREPLDKSWHGFQQLNLDSRILFLCSF